MVDGIKKQHKLNNLLSLSDS